MSKLIANVWAAGQGWGPDYGNADQVPADVAAELDDPAVWDDSKVPGNAKAAAPAPAPDPVQRPASPLDLLAALPDDKDLLLGFRDEHDLDVDGRLGVDKLRIALQDALG